MPGEADIWVSLTSLLFLTMGSPLAKSNGNQEANGAPRIE